MSADNLFHCKPTTTFVVLKLDAALKMKLIEYRSSSVDDAFEIEILKLMGVP